MIVVIVGLSCFILGAIAMSMFGAKVSAEAVEEIHAVEARWAHLIANLKIAAKNGIDKL